MIKTQVQLQLKDFKFLNDVETPFLSSSFKKQASKYNDFKFLKTAGKDEPKDIQYPSLKFPEDFDLKQEMQDHGDNLYIKALAIIADEPNENGDYFPKDELLKSFHSFVGCPLFCNHKNDDVEEARGTIVYAEWDHENNGIMVVGRVDAKAYPKLARGIAEGYITGVSMGCQVERSKCSICDNDAAREDEYCEHIKTQKTRTHEGKKVFEKNFGIKFIELSFVVDPACDICFIQEIFDVEDVLDKVASIGEGLKKIAKRVAGKAEIDKLNQAENLIQDVAKTMLNQKDYLDLEYVADLVESLSKLQQTKDELVDMGYEQVPSNVQSTQENNATPPMMEDPMAPPMDEGAFPEEFNNVTTNSTAGEVGTVTMPGQFASKFKEKLKLGSNNNNFNTSVRKKLINKWHKE